MLLAAFVTVAILQSGPIPEEIIPAPPKEAWCVFVAPYGGSWMAPTTLGYCWAGFVTQAGEWTIKVYGNGHAAEGSDRVPGAECTPGAGGKPLCTIPLEVVQ